ncbi:MAG: Cys-tRNA(Pro)/Cys-tRNA(Cys) deacylase YbaK [Peptostreptococcus russellii]|uniref:Cys-tRNA(Pro)/Cys-tRNA(Cys) deacylase n=1 Tax=Peptostreptococcus russellii TaxID=215200 RepID=A0A2P7Q0U1_9FIRM|nr:Cys-tRNA(Pro) deacylase [Peptostreptococcus russellii]PSJ31576.1 prolyl-tRNA synthetase [Peptostreptococcus russellii]
MSKKKVKTNAMRILELEKIEYIEHSYPVDKDHVDGITAAKHIGKDPKTVYKTLVTQGQSKEYYVFVIPVAENLNMKKAAKASGEKKVEMIHVKDINKITGYIRGGCSPIGMKKQYSTYIDKSAKSIESITVSAGKLGYQVELSPSDLIKASKAEYADLLM